MENNSMLPSAARSDAASPMPEETTCRVKIESPEPASARARSPSEVPGNTVLDASDEAPAGNVPNDAELQLVLRNAHPFQDASLSLAQRVDAFKLFEKEVRDTQAYWKNKGDRPTCQECGKKHAPPHTTKEQQAAVGAAFREGKSLRKELNRQLNNMPRSRLTGVAPAAPPVRKPKAIFCEACAKWHLGGKDECRAPLCPLGCGRSHMPEEDCDYAVKRFSRVKEAQKAKGKSAAPPTPSFSAAASNSSFDLTKFAALYDATPQTEENMRSLGSLLNIITNAKRPTAEPAEISGSSKRQKKKNTGQGSSCQGPQSHYKGPPKPDDKGKGRAVKPKVKPEPTWE